MEIAYRHIFKALCQIGLMRSISEVRQLNIA
ncbi:hypothetical protein CD170_12615 [Staphylococcus aureus]|nr:hypothetical protein CD170_12615 [Staphylococcus aureus]QOJ77982.1 hypothetical protein MVF7_03535 [Staphylococcus aureus]